MSLKWRSSEMEKTTRNKWTNDELIKMRKMKICLTVAVIVDVYWTFTVVATDVLKEKVIKWFFKVLF